MGIVSFVALSFAVMFMGVSGISTIGFVLCLLATLGLSNSGILRNRPHNALARLFLYAAVVLSGLLALHILFGRSPGSSFELGLRFLISLYFVATLAAFARHQTYSFVNGLVLIATLHVVVLTVTAIVQVYFSDTDPLLVRAHGDNNAIPFSEMMTTGFGIVAIWIYCKAQQEQALSLVIGLTVWFLTMIFTVNLTGTRGSIIAVYPLLIGLLVFCIRDQDATVLKAGLLLALGALIWTTVTEPRFAMGVVELAKTIDGTENAGSVGMRITMWGHAWEAIKSNPIIGHGMIPFRDIAGFSPESALYRFGHAHNQFIDVWMKLGIGGLLAFMVIIGTPFYSGTRDILKTGVHINALMKIWISGSFIVYGLTQSFLQHADSSIYFALFCAASLYLVDGKSVNRTGLAKGA